MSERRYRPGIAGPLILIFLGVVFLLNNLGAVEWTVWDVILRFWPVLLIAAGLDLVFARRSAWGSIIALMILLAVVGVSIGAIDQPPSSYASVLQVSFPQGNARRTEVRLNPAIGYLRVATGAGAGEGVLHGQVRTYQGEHVEQSSQPVGGRLSVEVVSRSGVVFPFFTMDFSRPNWDMAVDPSIPLDLRTDLSVGKTVLDLRAAQLTMLSVNTSLGQTIIQLPATTAEVKVEGGIGEIVLQLPTQTGISIKASTGIGRVDLPAGYTLRDGMY